MKDCVRNEDAMKSTGNGKKGRSKRNGKKVLGAPKRRQLARERAIAALSAMRRGATLARAARENGVTARTVRRYVGSELVQGRPGARVRATKSDRLVRHLVIPGVNGPKEIPVRGSKSASEFARYQSAVNRFLRGDRDALAAWHGKKIAGIDLITAGETLKSLAHKGLLPHTFYRAFTGGAR